MTDIPKNTSGKKLGLVIDLDICVGCHACAVNCKEWNTSGHSAPLPDNDPFGANVDGVWFNRVHTFECGEGTDSRTVHFPRSCLHCEHREFWAFCCVIGVNTFHVCSVYPPNLLSFSVKIKLNVGC